ncbi:hypothetical protein DICPUDRAFT_151426 [Dictyostelium purpureum]|uniref:Ras-associating domain-containing protein n=1 Tax=Dictyostelium purpureum TaxID=5786 RepID=F0ZIT3_DICPU|nr:uncharacterized protein DICPUDRAFT_151426 [Dictyostelium purpureum]EGC36131.1 hypothetical protein DICPUDRAFT_151426 [Dictyostelium purpureum]|eukprot:XP_003287324.1 hypothetical protein DICPUDRAFT_151426 [Dictyostelium purpureum]
MLEKFDYDLIKSAANNDTKKLREILDCGVDINMMEFDKGTTALHIACSRGNKQIIELLVSRGADVNVQDNRGVTPLHSLVTNRYDILALWLIRHGGNIKIQDNNGFAPYDYAQGWFQREMVLASEGKTSQSEEQLEEQQKEIKQKEEQYQQQVSTLKRQMVESASTSGASSATSPKMSGYDTVKGGILMNSSEVLKVFFRGESYKSVKVSNTDTARDLCKIMAEKFNMPSYDKCFDICETVKGRTRFLQPTDYLIPAKSKWPIIVGTSGNETHLHCFFSVIIRKTAPKEAVELFEKVL